MVLALRLIAFCCPHPKRTVPVPRTPKDTAAPKYKAEPTQSQSLLQTRCVLSNDP